MHFDKDTSKMANYSHYCNCWFVILLLHLCWLAMFGNIQIEIELEMIERTAVCMMFLIYGKWLQLVAIVWNWWVYVGHSTQCWGEVVLWCFFCVSRFRRGFFPSPEPKICDVVLKKISFITTLIHGIVDPSHNIKCDSSWNFDCRILVHLLW